MLGIKVFFCFNEFLERLRVLKRKLILWIFLFVKKNCDNRCYIEFYVKEISISVFELNLLLVFWIEKKKIYYVWDVN